MLADHIYRSFAQGRQPHMPAFAIPACLSISAGTTSRRSRPPSQRASASRKVGESWSSFLAGPLPARGDEAIRGGDARAVARWGTVTETELALHHCPIPRGDAYSKTSRRWRCPLRGTAASWAVGLARPCAALIAALMCPDGHPLKKTVSQRRSRETGRRVFSPSTRRPAAIPLTAASPRPQRSRRASPRERIGKRAGEDERKALREAGEGGP
jgi:hypothetical protein